MWQLQLLTDKGVAMSDIIFQIASNQFRSDFAAKWVRDNQLMNDEWPRVVAYRLLANKVQFSLNLYTGYVLQKCSVHERRANNILNLYVKQFRF